MSTALPDIGELFEDRYRIEGKLGEGGFAWVFLATDMATHRDVAIKIIKPDDQGYSRETRARLRREVSALAALGSPHIVRLLRDGETSDGLLYVVFEHVPGEDLSTVFVDQDRVAPDIAEHILRQLLDALGEAHRAGVLHRDIKPENIRVCENPHDPWLVKLLDFGLARPLAEGSPSVTATGELLGTPRYMSPEQLTGKPLTPASDVYSLGLVALELVAGRAVLPGGSWAAQVERLRSGYQFVPEQADMPASRLLSVIARMTAKNPADRLETVAAVRGALDGVVIEDERDQGPPSRPWLLVAAVILTVVLVGAAVSSFTDDEEPIPLPPSNVPYALLNTAEREPPPPPEPVAPKPDAGPTLCGTPVEQGDNPVGTAILYVPPSYDRTRDVPLVVVFHQANQPPEEILRETKLRAVADAHGFLLLAPQGRMTSIVMGKTRRSLSPWAPTQANLIVSNLRSLGQLTDDSPTEKAARTIRDVVESHCVDSDAVFAIGHTHGGEAVHRMACETNIFAGVAITSHRFVDGREGQRCPLPMLLISPTELPGEPPDGSWTRGCPHIRGLSSIDGTEKRYAEHHICTGRKRTAPDLHPECSRWENCSIPFAACRADGGRHWPGMTRDAYPEWEQHDIRCAGEPSTFPYSDVIWRFFESVNEDKRAAADAGR